MKHLFILFLLFISIFGFGQKQESTNAKLKDALLVMDYKGYPYIFYKSSLVTALEDSVKIISFPEVISPSSINTIYPSGFYYSIKNILFHYGEKGNERIENFSKAGINDLKIAPIDSCNFFLIAKTSNNQYKLYIYNGIDKKKQEILTTKKHISSVAGNKDYAMVAIDNAVYLLHNSQLKKILEDEDKINALVNGTFDGTFYATDNQIVYFNADGVWKTVREEGANQLICNDFTIYFITVNNSFNYIPITPVSTLQEQSKSFEKTDLSKLKMDVAQTPESEDFTRLVNVPRTLILAGQIPHAIQEYAQLVNKNETNSALLSEYAYVLALCGVYDGALMNLDRAKVQGTFSGNDYFYAGQVFALMGYNQPAKNFLNKSSVPQWIYPKYNEYYQKYKSHLSFSQNESMKNLFDRANYLTLNGMDFQSIALYEQILEKKPDLYLFHIGYSITLEKVGLNKLAADELESGIALMGDTPQFDKPKKAFQQRLINLRQKPENADIPKVKVSQKQDTFSPQTMLYLGGMLSENNMAFNSQIGLYLTNSFNAALNLGISGNSAATNFNIGLYGYERLAKVIVLGLGLNYQAGSGSNLFNVAPTLGLSFVNKKRNSSWDIFFNDYYPLKQGGKSMYGFSVGKSFYFGTRK